MVELNHDKIPLYKMVVHVAQIVLSVTIWCLEIAVFKGGDANGNMGWTFGVCFLSIPAWIYLIMAPRYPRAANIAQPNALVTVDALMTIIWLSAFATQAAYNSANDCGSACAVSKAIVGLGVFETLLWVVSTLISWATLQYYNTNGVLPGYENLHRGRTHTLNDIDPDKAAFSTAPADEEAYAPLGGLHDHDDPMEPEFNAGPYHSTGSPSHHDPDSFGSSHLDTSYGGAAGTSMNSRYDSTYDSHAANTAYESHSSPAPAGGALYSPPQVHDEEYDGPAQFPAGNYDNIGLRQV